MPVGAVAGVAVALGAARRGPTRAMFLGAAAGLSFGVLSVLTKTVTHLLSTDVARAFVTWQVYAAIGVGIAALVVSQSAYQAGPLAYSMPFVGVLEPVVAIVISDTVLGEQVRLSEGPVRPRTRCRRHRLHGDNAADHLADRAQHLRGAARGGPPPGTDRQP